MKQLSTENLKIIVNNERELGGNHVRIDGVADGLWSNTTYDVSVFSIKMCPFKYS